MSNPEDDLLEKQAGRTLREAYQSAPPVHLAARIDQSVHAHLAASTPHPHRTRLPFLRRSRVRIAAAALAACLVAGGVVAEFHGSGATPVSAQTVFHRAAAAGPAAGDAQHLTYRLTTSDGYAGTGDLWVGQRSGPNPDLLALTETMSRNDAPAPQLGVQFVSNGGAPEIYDPASNTITVGKWDITSMSGLRLLVGIAAAPKVENLLHLGNAASLMASHKITHGTLGGVGVYIIPLGDLGTLSFNDQTYVLEGLDWSDGHRDWQARLISQETVPLASVPAGTFQLHAPASARTVQSPGEPQPGAKTAPDPVDLMTALAAACRTTPQALKAALGAQPSATPLQLCQQSRPGVTIDQLTTDMLAQIKAQLDAAVANSSISRADADAEYEALQHKLGLFLTSSLAGPAGGKQAPKP